MWNTFLVWPILNLLVGFYHLFFSNLGLAILGLTGFVRFLLFPLVVPVLRMAEKQRKLQPELSKLREKYQNDRDRLAREQLALLSQHGVNPAIGCLPQIAQLVILIALYQVFVEVLAADGVNLGSLNQRLYFDFLKFPAGAEISTRFLYLDLAQPDPYYILPGLAGLLQWLLLRLGKAKPVAKEGSEAGEGVVEASEGGIMGDMQSQMGAIFPLLTVFIGLRLQSGLALYWLASMLLSLLQQRWVQRRAA